MKAPQELVREADERRGVIFRHRMSADHTHTRVVKTCHKRGDRPWLRQCVGRFHDQQLRVACGHDELIDRDRLPSSLGIDDDRHPRIRSCGALRDGDGLIGAAGGNDDDPHGRTGKLHGP